nr:PaaI family thioesterase [Candidatus Sigynarchaeota archaeon]
MLEHIPEGYEKVDRAYPEEDGFVHNCFGCSPTNPIGMKLEFFGKPGQNEIITVYKVGQDYSGFPAYAHGGIIALLFDEILAYASYHVHHQFGMTKSMTVEYKRPVLIDKYHFVRAEVVSTKQHPKGLEATVDASIHEGCVRSGALCAKASGTVVLLEKPFFETTYKQTR